MQSMLCWRIGMPLAELAQLKKVVAKCYVVTALSKIVAPIEDLAGRG